MNTLNAKLHNAKLAKDRQGSQQGWSSWKSESYFSSQGKVSDFYNFSRKSWKSKRSFGQSGKIRIENNEKNNIASIKQLFSDIVLLKIISTLSKKCPFSLNTLGKSNILICFTYLHTMFSFIWLHLYETTNVYNLYFEAWDKVQGKITEILEKSGNFASGKSGKPGDRLFEGGSSK